MKERDEENLSNGLELLFDSYLKGKRTVTLGQVIEVTSDKYCKIQPALMRLREGQTEPERLPEVHDVPRGFSSGGPWVISYRLHVGDVVVLFVSDRSLATWLSSGGVVDPQVDDFWDINDCIVGPRIFSDVDDKGEDVDGVTIRKIDGSVFVNVKGDSVETNVGGQSLTVTAAQVTTTMLVESPDVKVYRKAPDPPASTSPGKFTVADHQHWSAGQVPAITSGPVVTEPDIP